MSKYTPTTSEVRYAYGDARCPDLKEDHGLGCPADADFDQWLEQRREVARYPLHLHSGDCYRAHIEYQEGI